MGYVYWFVLLSGAPDVTAIRISLLVDIIVMVLFFVLQMQ